MTKNTIKLTFEQNMSCLSEKLNEHLRRKFIKPCNFFDKVNVFQSIYFIDLKFYLTIFKYNKKKNSIL